MMRAICLLILSTILSATPAHAINRVFLLDTSGSMKEGGLFERIKEVMIEDYVSDMRNGEHIIVLGFDESVVLAVDQDITSEEDRRKVSQEIRGLRADGQWTWMDRALDMTRQQTKRMREAYGEDPVIVYFFTDGEDAPPPGAHEAPRPLADLLADHSDGFRTDRANVYVLLYGDQRDMDQADKDSLADLGIHVGHPDSVRGGRIMYPEVVLDGAFDFGEIILGEEALECVGVILVRELKNDAAGRHIQLSWVSEDLDARISPTGFTLAAVGQQQPVVVTVPTRPDDGEHVAWLRVEHQGEMIVSPREFPVRLTIVSRPDRLKWLIALIALAGAYLGLLWLHSKRYYVERADDGQWRSVVARHLKWTPLEDAGLPTQAVELGAWPWEFFTLFFWSEATGKSIVKMGESVFKCETPGGMEVSVEIHDRPRTELGSTPPIKPSPDDPFQENKEW